MLHYVFCRVRFLTCITIFIMSVFSCNSISISLFTYPDEGKENVLLGGGFSCAREGGAISLGSPEVSVLLRMRAK